MGDRVSSQKSGDFITDGITDGFTDVFTEDFTEDFTEVGAPKKQKMGLQKQTIQR